MKNQMRKAKKNKLKIRKKNIAKALKKLFSIIKISFIFFYI